jgi:hypothetical protein
MRDMVSKFGDNAGKLWITLNDKGSTKKSDILKITGLDENSFYSAIGWLAKENKIYKDNNDCFRLDNTNLDGEIGTDAGKIWKILDIWGDADLKTIKRLSDLNEDRLYAALGWLARENKIYLDENQRYNLK